MQVIWAEQELARLTYRQERNGLIEDFLLLGEQLGFPLLCNDDFLLEAGVGHWSLLCEKASLEHLYQGRDIAHVKRQEHEDRKRLRQLAPR